MQQPGYEDGVDAWRKFAGDLRRVVGEERAGRRAAEERVDVLRGRVRVLQEQLEIVRDRVRVGKQRSATLRTLFRHVLGDLQDGDMPAALDRLIEWRDAVEAARERRDTQRPEVRR